MVCIQSTGEVLVAFAKEMAEGPMDCLAGTMVGYAYFIAYQQTKGICTRRSDTDSFDYCFDGASKLFRLTLKSFVLYDNQHTYNTPVNHSSLLPEKDSSESLI